MVDDAVAWHGGHWRPTVIIWSSVTGGDWVAQVQEVAGRSTSISLDFYDPPTRSIYSTAKVLGVAQGPHLRLLIG